MRRISTPMILLIQIVMGQIHKPRSVQERRICKLFEFATVMQSFSHALASNEMNGTPEILNNNMVSFCVDR